MQAALRTPQLSASKAGQAPRTRRTAVVVRAEGGQINLTIQKDNPKVVDTVVASQLDKPMVAYCRCWRSGTFPLCDASHVKHNKDNNDNCGPLLVKKE